MTIPAAMTACPSRIIWMSLSFIVRNPLKARPTVIEQAGEAGGCLCRNPLEQIQVAACPQPGCLFQRAVAEEAQHDFFCAWDPYDLAQG